MRFRKDDTDILDIVQIILCTIAILAILLTPIFIMVKIKSDSGGESGKPTKRCTAYVKFGNTTKIFDISSYRESLYTENTYVLTTTNGCEIIAGISNVIIIDELNGDFEYEIN